MVCFYEIKLDINYFMCHISHMSHKQCSQEIKKQIAFFK